MSDTCRVLKVVLVYDAKLPVVGYGGTERVVWWLSKGLNELGIKVVLACQQESRSPYAEVISPDFSKPIEPQIPDVDVFHYFNTPSWNPELPYIVTIGGNGKVGEGFLPNTVFISQNHAKRHSADCFVYNGIDPSEYVFQEKKKDFLIFLAKASWRVKNVKGAIRIARKSLRPLHIMGGKRLFFNHLNNIHWEGMVGGQRKVEFLSEASGLLFPVEWHEPFGIAIVESLISGSPVIGSPYGALPELIPPYVGNICRTETEFVEAAQRLSEFEPKTCREWALEKFHYQVMAKRYVELYKQVLSGDKLNRQTPKATQDPREGCRIPG